MKESGKKAKSKDAIDDVSKQERSLNMKAGDIIARLFLNDTSHPDRQSLKIEPAGFQKLTHKNARTF